MLDTLPDWRASPLGEQPDVADERLRRANIWRSLCARYPGGRNVDAPILKELRIIRSVMGIYFDGAVTKCNSAPLGIAVGLMWSHHYNEPPPQGDRFEYSYPLTDRPEARNRNEIETVKAAQRLKLPVFLIDAVTDRRKRHVHPTWIIDFDDEMRTFLLSLSPPIAEVASIDDRPFELFENRGRKLANVTARDGQREFSFNCFRRYGIECALCGTVARAMLDAAHLCPYRENGASDPRNGLILCKSHHAAFDAGLLAIHPVTLALELLLPGLRPSDINLQRLSIGHLRAKPHPKALQWAYEFAQAIAQRRTAKTEQQRRYRAKRGKR